MCVYSRYLVYSPLICIPQKNKQPHKKTCPKQQQSTATQVTKTNKKIPPQPNKKPIHTHKTITKKPQNPTQL